MFFEAYSFLLTLKIAINSTYICNFPDHHRKWKKLTVVLTCFANAHWISICLCQAGWIVYAWIVRQLTGTEALVAEVTSIKWRTNAYKLPWLHRFKTGGSIQAWFRLTFIYIFTAVWPCPACCTCASGRVKEKEHWCGRRKINSLAQSLPTFSS